MNSQRRPLIAAPRFTPLWGAAVGAVGGGVYWIGAQFWPTSIAVALSMAATALVATATSPAAARDTAARDPAPGAPNPTAHTLVIVFTVLIKYNALMALSAASLPYPLPANIALALIMIAGHAASRALFVSVQTASTHSRSAPPSHIDVGIALAVGLGPAALLGMTGLIGLVAAILARILFMAYAGRSRVGAGGAGGLEIVQPLTEVCFYLGAAAASTFI